MQNIRRRHTHTHTHTHTQNPHCMTAVNMVGKNPNFELIEREKSWWEREGEGERDGGGLSWWRGSGGGAGVGEGLGWGGRRRERQDRSGQDHCFVRPPAHFQFS